MAIITFMSDFGTGDHYVAAVKAKLLSADPALVIVDISHGITAFDIAHGAYVLRSVFRDFPPGTVHLVGVGTGVGQGRYIALSLEGHYFLAADNGLLSMLSEQEPSLAVLLDGTLGLQGTFPTRDILAPFAAKLASGEHLESFGERIMDIKRLLDRQPRATRKAILGHVVRVDHFGNLITNIAKVDFDILSKGKPYTIRFGRERMSRIHERYDQVEAGDCFILFNGSGYMEIGINQGNASELLGLYYDSPINVQFEGG